jgi:hypothetical protein
VRRNVYLARAMWPALLLAILAFVVLDFIEHPFLGAASDAAVTPQAHLTLWLAQAEASSETGAAVAETAGSLLLYGKPATVGVLQGGSSQAVSGFLGQRRAPGQLLAVSSNTLADLAQERSGVLFGGDPLRAARAQALLARAIGIGVLSVDSLCIAVPVSSPVRDAGELLSEVRRSAQSHVFAITGDSWAADNLAALVKEAGVEGVVPYRVFPSAEDAALALSAGSAGVILAPRRALAGDVRAHRLRMLAWPASAGPEGRRGAGGWVPQAFLELLAPPGTPARRVGALRRQVRALAANTVWRRLLRSGGQASASSYTAARLGGFLAREMTLTAGLQQISEHVERR